MHYGKFEVLQIAYNAAGAEVFRATGSGMMSLAYMQSERVLTGSIGLSITISLLGFIAFITVMSRRFELFSSISLFLFASLGAASSYLQIVQV